jgi:hypothetical protein
MYRAKREGRNRACTLDGDSRGQVAYLRAR